MLLSEALALFESSSENSLTISEKVLKPSKLVLFLCDIIAIIQKSIKDCTAEYVAVNIKKMLQQRQVESIPGLLEDDANADHDHFIKNKFNPHNQPKEVKFIFQSTQTVLYQALQMMNQASVIFTDEEGKHIITQFQTIHFRQILKKNCIDTLLQPAYQLFQRINQEQIDDFAPYVVWATGVSDIMTKNHWDYAIIMEGQSIKDVKGVMWL